MREGLERPPLEDQSAVVGVMSAGNHQRELQEVRCMCCTDEPRKAVEAGSWKLPGVIRSLVEP